MTYELNAGTLLAVESARYKALEAFVDGIIEDQSNTYSFVARESARAARKEAEEAGKAAYFKGVTG